MSTQNNKRGNYSIKSLNEIDLNIYCRGCTYSNLLISIFLFDIFHLILFTRLSPLVVVILLLRKCIYHTLHFLIGFIGLPTGQPKSVENSCMLEKGPRTRNISGAWTPVSTRSFKAFGRYFAHQTFAALTQNNWRCV